MTLNLEDESHTRCGSRTRFQEKFFSKRDNRCGEREREREGENFLRKKGLAAVHNLSESLVSARARIIAWMDFGNLANFSLSPSPPPAMNYDIYTR